MLETCVEVGLFSEIHNFLEMRVVNVSIDTEESLEDVFHNVLEILREGGVWSGERKVRIPT
jgi:hypothetical protein